MPDEGLAGVGSGSDDVGGGGGFGAEEGIDVDRKARRVGSRSRKGSVEVVEVERVWDPKASPSFCGFDGESNVERVWVSC